MGEADSSRIMACGEVLAGPRMDGRRFEKDKIIPEVLQITINQCIIDRKEVNI
jgi:hypothetical protein